MVCPWKFCFLPKIVLQIFVPIGVFRTFKPSSLIFVFFYIFFFMKTVKLLFFWSFLNRSSFEKKIVHVLLTKQVSKIFRMLALFSSHFSSLLSIFVPLFVPLFVPGSQFSEHFAVSSRTKSGTKIERRDEKWESNKVGSNFCLQILSINHSVLRHR